MKLVSFSKSIEIIPQSRSCGIKALYDSGWRKLIGSAKVVIDKDLYLNFETVVSRRKEGERTTVQELWLEVY